MKQAILFGLFFLITVSTFGQIEKKINDILLQKDYVKLKQFVKTYQLEKDNIQISEDLKREIIHDFQEAKISIRISEVWHKGLPISGEEHINLILSGNQIIYYYFKSEKTSGYPDTLIIKTDTIYQFRNAAKMKLLNTAFKKTYGSNLNMQDLFIDTIYYGNACGHSGKEVPTEQKLIYNWIDSKDTMSLISWLRSPNAEKQIYSIQGLYALQKKGVRISDNTLKLISTVMLKKGTINTCHRCGGSSEKIALVAKNIMQ